MAADRDDKMTKYYKRTGQKFLDSMAKAEGVHKLPSGMLYRVIKDGKSSGKKSSPNVGDSCEVTYSGKLKDGTPFDSGTTSFAPNQVIKGWTEALQVCTQMEAHELDPVQKRPYLHRL
jgi:FKBP-type peptidyl-prolyl cis-trans isomerase FklB